MNKLTLEALEGHRLDTMCFAGSSTYTGSVQIVRCGRPFGRSGYRPKVYEYELPHVESASPQA